MIDETAAIPMPESESPQDSLPFQPEVAPQPTAEPADMPSSTVTIQEAFITTKNYASVKTFLETCDTNPRVAVIVATPTLLAFFIVATFFVLSATVLILYSILTIFVGALVVIVGGIISCGLFPSQSFLLATLPMARMATGLLAGANSTSKFIILNASKSLKEIDWQSIVDGIASVGKYTVQAAKEAGPALVAIRDGLYTLGAATRSGLVAARAAWHHAQAGAQSSIDTVATTTTTTTSGVEPAETENALTASAAPVEDVPALEEDSDDGQHYALVELSAPIDILIDAREFEESPENLKRRVGYSLPGDDH